MLALVSLLVLALQGCHAWGGLFNRFSPEMLSNLGYGGHASNFREQPFMQCQPAPSSTHQDVACTMLADVIVEGDVKQRVVCTHAGPLDTYQELQDAVQEDPCYGKRCTANEHCCPGSVCVDVDGIVGSCLFAYGLRQGELCRRDNDCETGLLCSDSGDARSCQPPLSSTKLYNEDCGMSSECDIHRGLCCQFQRRHRQAPRKVCSYFKDPLVCIGPVASDQIKMMDNMDRTAGEKRITSKTASSFNQLRV